MNRKTLGKKKKKYRLWKRYLELKDADVYKQYFTCRNQLRRLTRKAAKEHEKNIAKTVKTNCKGFWKYVNSKTKMRSSVPQLYKNGKDSPEILTNSDQEKANILGKFFASVFVKEPDWIWLFNEDEKPKIRMKFSIDITKEVISKKLKELNPSKSPGPDNLHSKVFRELESVLVDPLYIIFNTSLKTNKVPKPWKLASVTPIYKNKGRKHCTDNYRPVLA